MKRWKKNITATVLTLALLFQTIPAQPLQAAGKVKSVKVTNVTGKTLSLEKGKSKTLKVKVVAAGKGTVSQKVTFRSDNTKVVKVSNKGKVTAIKKGSAKVVITAKADKKKKFTLKVKVTDKSNDAAGGQTQAPQATQTVTAVPQTTTTAPQATQTATVSPQTTQPTGADPQATQPTTADPQDSEQPTTEPAESQNPQATDSVETADPQETEPAETQNPQETDPAQTQDPQETNPPAEDPDETEAPHYRYIDVVDDETSCLEHWFVRWQKSYEVCLEGVGTWEDCKGKVSVILSEDYAEDYDFEIVYSDEDYDTYSDFEKATKLIEVGHINVFAKDDVDKKSVAVYALKFRKRYNMVDGIEGGRILLSSIDMEERAIELYAFTDWRTNFGEDASCIEELVVMEEGQEYLSKMEFDAPNIINPEQTDSSYAGMLYIYDKTDVNKKSPVTAYQVLCDTIPDVKMTTDELSCVRMVRDFSLKSPTLEMYISEDINTDNVDDIISKIKIEVEDEVEGYVMEEWEWDTSFLEGEYPTPWITANVLLRSESASENSPGICWYSFRCRGRCYVTEIEEAKLSQLSWEETDGLIELYTSSAYVPDGEEGSTTSILQDSIKLPEGYTATVTWDDVNYHETQAYYKLNIYQGDTSICTKGIIYHVVG